MFNQTLCQENSPLGVNMHFTYFCKRNFFIWTTTKVQGVDNKSILVVLATYLVLKYLLFQNYIQFFNYWFCFKRFFCMHVLGIALIYQEIGI
jgi:hypothetical protein